jgi:hypothetical protein
MGATRESSSSGGIFAGWSSAEDARKERVEAVYASDSPGTTATVQANTSRCWKVGPKSVRFGVIATSALDRPVKPDEPMGIQTRSPVQFVSTWTTVSLTLGRTASSRYCQNTQWMSRRVKHRFQINWVRPRKALRTPLALNREEWPESWSGMVRRVKTQV